MADIMARLKQVTPTQWALIGGSGVLLGYLYYRHKKSTAAAAPIDTSAVDTATSQGVATTAAYANTPPTGAVSFTPSGSPFPVSISNLPASDIEDIIKTLIPPSTAPAPVPVNTPTVPSPAPTPAPAPAPAPTPSPIVMSQAMYLGAVGADQWATFSQNGGYLDQFFANPNAVQIIGGNGQPATTTQVLADLQARGLPIKPTWRAIN